MLFDVWAHGVLLVKSAQAILSYRNGQGSRKASDVSFSRRGRDWLAEASAAIFVAVSENTGDGFTGDSVVAVVNGETEKPKCFAAFQLHRGLDVQGGPGEGVVGRKLGQWA